MNSEQNSLSKPHWANSVPPISTIAALDAVVRLGTFAAAAEALNRTPSAISHAVRDFERRAGVSLFVRRGKRVAVSEVGRAYVRDLQDAIVALKRSNRTLSLFADEPLIRISAPPLFAATVLIPHMSAFEAKFAPHRLTIETTNQLVDLHASDTDIAIRFARSKEAGLHYRALPRLQIKPVCAASYAGRLKASYAGATLIQSTQNPRAWQRYLKDTHRVRPKSSRLLAFDSTVSALEAARQGLGVVLGMFPMVGAYPGFGTELITVPDQPAVSVPGYRMVCRSASKDLTKIRVFSEWLQAAVEAMDARAGL